MASTLALVGQQLTVYHVATFDVPAYAIDSAYGFAASAVLGKILWAHPRLHQSFGIIYGWLPAAVTVCYGLNVRAGNRNAGIVRNATLVGGAIAFLLYHFYPAAGPIYAFGSAFPAALPEPSTLSMAPTGLALPGAARNCMPSVHFFCALLAAIEARRLTRAWQSAFFLFAALTALATIALGEHYLIDLVVAIPFTLSIHAICSRSDNSLLGWRFTASFGAVATLCWLALLRLLPSFTAWPSVLWVLTLITIPSAAAVAVAYLSDNQADWRPLHFWRHSARTVRTEAGRLSAPGHSFVD